jgi:hypothetical protein
MGHIWVTIGQIHSNSSFLDYGMIILNPALALKRELKLYTITENIGIYSASKRIVALIKQKTHTQKKTLLTATLLLETATRQT